VGCIGIKKDLNQYHYESIHSRIIYVPAATFIEEYDKTAVDDEVKAMATELIKGRRGDDEVPAMHFVT